MNKKDEIRSPKKKNLLMRILKISIYSSAVMVPVFLYLTVGDLVDRSGNYLRGQNFILLKNASEGLKKRSFEIKKCPTIENWEGFFEPKMEIRIEDYFDRKFIFSIRETEEKGARLASLGFDGKFGTKDDIIHEFHISGCF